MPRILRSIFIGVLLATVGLINAKAQVSNQLKQLLITIKTFSKQLKTLVIH